MLVTLIYLSVQVRQNTRSMDQSRKVELARNRTQTAQMRVDWMLAEATSPEIVSFWARLKTLEGWPDDPERVVAALTEEERGMIRRLQSVNRIINENARYQFEEGLIDEQSYASSARVLEVMTPIWEALQIPQTLNSGATNEVQCDGT